MREFNVTGTCVKSRHYMADTSEKINEIVALIDREKYFTINRPRQYGKTTTLSLLRKRLENDYTVLNLSFEKVGKESYVSVESFLGMLYRNIKRVLTRLKEEVLLERLEGMKGITTFDEFDDFLTDFLSDSPKEVILLIDECDDGSNNDVFLKFLGVLRNKYLLRAEDLDVSFKSVILAGIEDIIYWNIATRFEIAMSFNEAEIQSLLKDYLSENSNTKIDVKLIARKIQYLTNGYPLMVSYLCKMIHEDFEGDDKWSVQNLEHSANKLIVVKVPIFESFIKIIESHSDLMKLVHMILIEDVSVPFGISTLAMEKGLQYGILTRSEDNKLVIHNPIFEMKFYNYLIEYNKAMDVGCA